MAILTSPSMAPQGGKQPDLQPNDKVPCTSDPTNPSCNMETSEGPSSTSASKVNKDNGTPSNTMMSRHKKAQNHKGFGTESQIIFKVYLKNQKREKFETKVIFKV